MEEEKTKIGFVEPLNATVISFGEDHNDYMLADILEQYNTKATIIRITGGDSGAELFIKARFVDFLGLYHIPPAFELDRDRYNDFMSELGWHLPFDDAVLRYYKSGEVKWVKAILNNCGRSGYKKIYIDCVSNSFVAEKQGV